MDSKKYMEPGNLPLYVKETAIKVKNLEIQGARNVAKAITSVFVKYIKEETFNSKEELVKKSMSLSLYLMDLRPTEPMLRNLIKELLIFLVNLVEKGKSIHEIKKTFARMEDTLLKLFEDSISAVSKIGASFIPEKAKIITHCHSSTVTSILKEAYDMGKNIIIYSSETRPKFQGRITAKELADYGIEVHFYVDSSMARFAKEADFALVGGDAITAEGDLLNKIGTLNLAIIMKHYGKPLYSAVELYKFNPETFMGMREEIEERDPREVWDIKNKNITIHNLAFDIIPSHLIKAYITNTGIIPPYSVKQEFDRFKEEFFKF